MKNIEIGGCTRRPSQPHCTIYIAVKRVVYVNHGSVLDHVVDPGHAGLSEWVVHNFQGVQGYAGVRHQILCHIEASLIYLAVWKPNLYHIGGRP